MEVSYFRTFSIMDKKTGGSIAGPPGWLWLFAVVAFGATRGVRVALIGGPKLPLSRAFAEIVDPMPLGKMRESDAPARVFFTRAVPNGTAGMIGHGVLLALRGRV